MHDTDVAAAERLIAKWKRVAAIAASLLIVGCSAQHPDDPAPHAPQRAGQPTDPLRTASLMAGAHVAAITGDRAGVQRNIESMSEDMRREMKLADPARPINPEATRVTARSRVSIFL